MKKKFFGTVTVICLSVIVVFAFVCITLVALFALKMYYSQPKQTSTETAIASNEPNTNNMNSDTDSLLSNYSSFISGLFENRMAQEASYWVDNNHNTFYSDIKCKHKIKNKNIRFIATNGIPVNPPDKDYKVDTYKMLDGKLCFCPTDTPIDWGVEYTSDLKIDPIDDDILLKNYSEFINALFQPQSVIYHWIDANNNTFYSDIECDQQINHNIRFASNTCITTSYDLGLDVEAYLMTDGRLCFYPFIFTDSSVKLKRIN